MKISAKKYAAALSQTFSEAKPADRQAVIRNFVALLGRHNQLSAVDQIISALADYQLAQTDGVKVLVTTTWPLAAKNQEQISRQLTKQLEKNVVLETQVDPGQLGGIKMQIGDSIIDGSLKTQLLNLKNSLIQH